MGYNICKWFRCGPSDGQRQLIIMRSLIKQIKNIVIYPTAISFSRNMNMTFSSSLINYFLKSRLAVDGLKHLYALLNIDLNEYWVSLTWFVSKEEGYLG